LGARNPGEADTVANTRSKLLNIVELSSDFNFNLDMAQGKPALFALLICITNPAAPPFC
jgi:hypothetical protein